MARSVSLREIQAWVANNDHLTWSLRGMPGWKRNTAIIKYMDLGFDTRTMDVFRISIRGACEDFMVHCGDNVRNSPNPDEVSILDLLDAKIKEILDGRQKG